MASYLGLIFRHVSGDHAVRRVVAASSADGESGPVPCAFLPRVDMPPTQLRCQSPAVELDSASVNHAEMLPYLFQFLTAPLVQRRVFTHRLTQHRAPQHPLEG